jgi:hypothetical protein
MVKYNVRGVGAEGNTPRKFPQISYTELGLGRRTVDSVGGHALLVGRELDGALGVRASGLWVVRASAAAGWLGERGPSGGDGGAGVINERTRKSWWTAALSWSGSIQAAARWCCTEVLLVEELEKASRTAGEEIEGRKLLLLRRVWFALLSCCCS